MTDNDRPMWERMADLSGNELAELKDRAAERIRWARHAFDPKHSRNFVGSDPRFKQIFPKTRGYSEYKFKEVESGEFGKGHEGFQEFIRGFAAFYNVDAEIFTARDIDEVGFQKMIRQGWVRITEKGEEVPEICEAEGRPTVDWGDGPEVTRFYGRTEELSLLSDWMGEEKCRLVTLTGMGGIGKTRLAMKAAIAQSRRSPGRFQAIVWRSLATGPSASEIVGDWLNVLGQCDDAERPGDFNGLTRRLLATLRSKPCLFILDNVETILLDRGRAGVYGAGYADYGRLFTLFAEVRHQGCLLLTCREQPKETATPSWNHGPVRTLPLIRGLSGAEAVQLFQSAGLDSVPNQACEELVRIYRGNPLALELAIHHIIDVFSGDIDEFLSHGNPVFDDITDILGTHFQRLNPGERSLVYWLALLREPAPISDLSEKLILPLSRRSLPSDMQSLQRRFPLEKTDRGFTLQPVLMEFVTDRLIEKICQEIRESAAQGLHTHALIGARGKDEIKAAQYRLVLDPILQILQGEEGTEYPAGQLRRLLSSVRETPALRHGYAGGNIINLLCRLGDDLNDCDFSRMTIRAADLQEKPLRDVDFSHAEFIDCTFTRNMGSILCLALARDGRFLAIADTSPEIRIWGLADDQPALTLRGHESWIRHLAFGPKDRLVASGGEDRTVRIWDGKTGACRRVLSGHSDRVQCLAFDLSGELLATGSHDHTIRIWETGGGDCIETLRLGGGAVYAVSFSPDGRFLAAACQDYGIRLLDLRKWKCRRTLRMPLSRPGPPRALEFSPDSSILAVAGDDRMVSLWDGRTFAFLGGLKGHTDRIRCIRFDRTGDLLLSSGEDRTIRIWNMDTRQCLRVLRGHTNRVRTMVLSPDNQTLFSGGDDRTLRRWDIGTGACLKTHSGYTNFIRSLRWTPAGESLASCGQDNTVRLWNPEDGTLLHTWSTRRHWPMTAGTVAGKPVAITTGNDFNIELRDLFTGRCLSRLSGHESWVREVWLTPDEERLVSGSDDGSVRIWDWRNERVLAGFTGHGDRVCAVGMDPRSRWIACGGYDRIVKIWDIGSGRCLGTLRGHTGRICSLGFSPDGRVLVSASGDHTLRIWDMETFECRQILTGHENWVRTAAFSPDASQIASGSEDGTLRIWQVQDGQCLRCLEGHDDWVMCLAYHPDGELLASGGTDETIRIWHPVRGQCLKILRSPRPYEGMNIFGVKGLTPSQTDALIALGARADVSE